MATGQLVQRRALQAAKPLMVNISQEIHNYYVEECARDKLQDC
jgi:hypothetical protein